MHIDKNIEDKIHQFIDTMPRNMSHALGIEFLSFKKHEVKAKMPVNENTIQPFGILHGGASIALAETLASIGAWLTIEKEEKAAVGVEINANHLRPMRRGTHVIGTACPVQLGKKIQVWETKIHSPADKLVCISRCTLAIVSSSQCD